MALFGVPRPTFFYPRISYGAGPTLIDFDDPAEVVIPSVAALAGQNVTSDGTREVLFERFETVVTVRFRHLSAAGARDLYTWFNTHAGKGLQSAVTLDRYTPTSVPSAAEGAAGNVNVGTHSYVVTFLRSGVEFPPTGPSGVVTVTTSAKQVNLTAIPTGPSDITARKIYRTVAGDTGDHKLVTTIADNTTTIYADNTADASLGAAVAVSRSAETWTFPIFSKAELLNLLYNPQRSVGSKNLYVLEMTFRQGT